MTINTEETKGHISINKLRSDFCKKRITSKVPKSPKTEICFKVDVWKKVVLTVSSHKYFLYIAYDQIK